MQSKFESVVQAFFRHFAVLLLLVMSGCGGGSSKSIPVGSVKSPLFTSAPATVTLQVGEISTFTVGGGSGLNGANFTTYAASSSNSSIATATLIAGQTSLTITGISQGTASVIVTDSAGDAVTIAVVVGNGSTGGGSPASQPIVIKAPSGGIVVGQQTASNYGVTGGDGNYTVSSSNPTVLTASINGTTLVLTGISAGTANVAVFDNSGNSASLGVTVTAAASNGSSGSQAIVIKAPTGGIVVGQQLASSYAVTGGDGKYTVSTSNPTVLTASINSNVLVLTGISAGTANVAVFDDSGNSESIGVTVTATGSALPLFVSAPDSVTLAANSSASYSITGGTSPYTAVSSNLTAVTASIANGLVTVNGISAGGTAAITVLDAANNSKTFAVNVGPVGTSITLFTTAPTAGVTISSGTSATYTIGGGTPPYAVVSSDASQATVALSGTSFTVTAVGSGLLVVGVVDSLGATVELNVTVP